MLLDITYAGGTVGIKQKGKYLAYPIGKQLTFFHITRAFSASIELVFLATRTNLTPSSLFILFTSRTFPGQELAAGSTIKSASSYVLSIGYDRFHKLQIMM